jgi:hypothetical protein
LKLSFERIDTEKKSGSVVTNETDDVVAWWGGVEFKLNDRLTMDLYRVWKLNSLCGDEVAAGTEMAFVFTFPL